MREVIEYYLKAGEVAKEARERGVELVKPGASVLEICEEVESIIRKRALPAFPCNLSISEVAAHYSPLPEDDLKIPERGVVKVDVGAHVEGYIADTAASVVLDQNYEKLSDAVREALEKALKIVRPGRRFKEVGHVIWKTIRQRGYKPIKNLSGHGLGRYLIHSGESIPNYPANGGFFKTERAYAIEPFGTDGEGLVIEGRKITIYSLNPKPPRGYENRIDDSEKQLIEIIAERFKTLPFSPRWLVDVYPWPSLERKLLHMARLGILIAYPELIESRRGMVAQWEHTVLVLKDKVIVTTR